MCKRNPSVLCLVDSSKREEFDQLQETTWSALDYFGMPYMVLDLAKDHLSLESARNHSVILISQEHLGECLSEEDTQSIVDAVRDGVGLVCFDGDIDRYRKPLKKALGLMTTEEPTHMPRLSTGMVRIWDNTHFITASKDLDFIRFNKPVDVGNIVSVEAEHRILIVVANNSGCLGMITESLGEGRVVLCTLSPKVWLREYFGHGGGLDDIFWKSIVWAARKPFTMLAMPPFVTIRIDDCSGANNFEWVRILNKHGFIPHVSIFTDNIGEKGAEIIKDLYDAELAEFSVHALTWTKQAYWKPKSPIDHREGTEYSQDELRLFFGEFDELGTKWGIKWSRVLTAHFGEVGRKVIPFLKEKGITYLGMPYAFGVPYGMSALGLPGAKLRGLKPFSGQGGVIDRHPDDPELFIAAPSYSDVPKSVFGSLTDKGVIAPGGQIYDFLWETARTKVDVERAAWYAAFGIKFCLDNLSFAVLVTHEQNISVLNNEEWDNLFSRVEELTSKYEKIYRSWSQIAEYARNLRNSRLTSTSYDTDPREMRCRVAGESNVTLYLHVFRDGADQVERAYKEISPFTGEITVSFKPEELLFKHLHHPNRL